MWLVNWGFTVKSVTHFFCKNRWLFAPQMTNCQVHGQPHWQLRPFQVEHRQLPLDGDQGTGIGHGVGGHKLQVGGLRKWCGDVSENGTHPEIYGHLLGNSWNCNWGHAIFRQTHISLCWNQVYQSTPKNGGTKTMITLFMDNRYPILVTKSYYSWFFVYLYDTLW